MLRVTEPVSPSDFEKIFDLRYRILRAPWNQPKGSESDTDESKCVHAMIADEQGECIATGRLQFNSPEEAQIRYMAVDERFRGMRLGKQILEFLEAKALERSCRVITLQARDNALDFYTAMGYSVAEQTFLLFGTIQHYRMTKSLG